MTSFLTIFTNYLKQEYDLPITNKDLEFDGSVTFIKYLYDKLPNEIYKELLLNNETFEMTSRVRAEVLYDKNLLKNFFYKHINDIENKKEFKIYEDDKLISKYCYGDLHLSELHSKLYDSSVHDLSGEAYFKTDHVEYKSIIKAMNKQDVINQLAMKIINIDLIFEINNMNSDIFFQEYITPSLFYIHLINTNHIYTKIDENFTNTMIIIKHNMVKYFQIKYNLSYNNLEFVNFLNFFLWEGIEFIMNETNDRVLIIVHFDIFFTIFINPMCESMFQGEAGISIKNWADHKVKEYDNILKKI